MLGIIKNHKNSIIKRISSRHREIAKKTVSLTFDDGPDRYYTPRILDILRAAGVKATFFIVGKNALKYPDIVKRIDEEGHDIGNHTFSHPVSPLLKIGKKVFIKREIMRTDKIIEEIIGSKPYLFRPPLATWDLNLGNFVKMAQSLGHLPVGWSRSSMDWLGNRWLIEYSLLNGRKSDGDIMLLHDGAESSLIKRRDATVETLPKVIDDCKSHKLEPLPLTELIK